MVVSWIFRWLIIGNVWTLAKYPLIKEEERLSDIKVEYEVPRSVARIILLVTVLLNIPLWPLDVVYTVYNVVKEFRH